MQPSLEAVSPVVANTQDAPAPACIGMIMDGNRRWAEAQGLPTLAGHEAGFNKLKEVLRWTKARGVKHLMVYAFSTENWNRSEEEVGYLMDLMRRVFKPGAKELEEIKQEGGRLRFVGQRERFSQDLQDALTFAENDTADGELTLWVGLSYGGRAEILNAVQEMQESGEEATEENFAKHLWTGGMPDPDIIIRTSGEQRLSGFLPWQGVYSELFFTETYWPAFSEEEFDRILGQFAERERRHGR